MKQSSIIILLFFLSGLIGLGQTRTLTGTVIDENLNPVAGIKIQNSDTSLLGTTAFDGQFKIEISTGTITLLISGIGYEWKSIKLTSNCNQLDIILMDGTTYDYISLKKVDKLRFKRFNKLRDNHLVAYKRGIFIAERPCYEQNFVPTRKNY